MNRKRRRRACEHYTIGQLALEFGITARALRFYEERGLLQPHRLGQDRLYSKHDRTKLVAILKGRALGLTISEIRSALTGDGSSLKLSAGQLQRQIEYLEKQKVQVDEALIELRAAKHATQEGDEPEGGPKPRRHLRR